jgi:hypothetical protein
MANGKIRFRKARKGENKSAYFLRIVIGKRRREFRLGSPDELPTRKAREEAAENLRLRLGVADSPAISDVTLERFAEHWYLTVAKGRLRPSTANDYRWRFEHYIKGRREARLPLRQYITRDIQNLLDGIAADHPKLSKAPSSESRRFSPVSFVTPKSPVYVAIIRSTRRSSRPVRPSRVECLASTNSTRSAAS